LRWESGDVVWRGNVVVVVVVVVLGEERGVGGEEGEGGRGAEVMVDGVEVLLTTEEMVGTGMVSIKQARGDSVMKLQQNASSHSMTKR
jgi:hypothetical protein